MNSPTSGDLESIPTASEKKESEAAVEKRDGANTTTNNKNDNAATPKPVPSSSTVSPDDTNANVVASPSHQESSVDTVAKKPSRADSPVLANIAVTVAALAAGTSETKDSFRVTKDSVKMEETKDCRPMSNENGDAILKSSVEQVDKEISKKHETDAKARETSAPPTVATENKTSDAVENLDSKMEEAGVPTPLVVETTGKSPSPSKFTTVDTTNNDAQDNSNVTISSTLESSKEARRDGKTLSDISSNENTFEPFVAPAIEAIEKPLLEMNDATVTFSLDDKKGTPTNQLMEDGPDMLMKDDGGKSETVVETKPEEAHASKSPVGDQEPPNSRDKKALSTASEAENPIPQMNKDEVDTEMKEAIDNTETTPVEAKSEDEAALKVPVAPSNQEPSGLQESDAVEPIAQTNGGDDDVEIKDVKDNTATALDETKSDDETTSKGDVDKKTRAETIVQEPPSSLDTKPPPLPDVKNPNGNGADTEMKVDNVKAESPQGEHEYQPPQESENKKDEPMEEEEEVEPTSLSELRDALDDIDTPGSTCAAGPATCLPAVPGLSVEGVGDIPLPITDIYAKSLASVAEQAPHGKGKETIVDTSVRNTLQIDPSKVALQNPAWKPALRELVRQAAESLGVAPSLVNAELYKLLLYEEGGFFKKHRDTEKSQGMFATLVVQLPSKFTGGSFVVSHGGESETFAMGAGGEAAFGCHFVCHYADCEHEILKVESGHRLALIYSLCYTGQGKPSAADVEHNYLTTVLQGLPADESLFVIPLEHQYTTASLAHLGASSLKGSDRAKQDAIEIAGKGKWRMIVAKAERTDSESGDGSYWGGFEVYDVERGSVSLEDAYHADGSDASDHLAWIRKQVNYDSVEDGGMMLVSSEDLEEDNGIAVWGEGDEGGVEYTGNEGATRETTYSTYFLIGFAVETAFERICAAEFSTAVVQVVREESADLMRRMLSYMKTKKPPITAGDCVKLLQATGVIDLSEKESVAAFATIMNSLSNKEMPSTELTDTLISSAERFGWSRVSGPMKSYSTKLLASKQLNSVDFLKQVDFLLRMEKASGLSDFATMAKQSTMDFCSQTDTQSTGNSYSRYSYSYHSSYNTSSQAASDALISFCQRHPREETKSIVGACILRMRKHGGSGSDKLVQRANLLQRLRSFHDTSDIESWFHGVVEDFVSMVEKLPPNSSAANRYSTSTGLLSNNNVDELFRRLFEFGSANEVQRVQRWATNVQLGELTQLETILNKVTSAVPASSIYCNTEAVNTLVQTVQNRVKTLKLSELHSRHQKLVASTQRGEPVFSWAMPQASTSNPALTAFLRSPRTGPETIVVGGGINNARKLASAGRYSYSYRSSDPLEQGYSATISATNATGRNASVRVTKTRALHEARVKKYREDASEIAKVAQEIRRLGGTVASPNVGNAGTATVRPIINLAGAVQQQPNPAKKRRVKAPIPSDAEIVEID